MLNNIMGPDSLVILAIVMLMFGPKNLPKLSKSIGSSIRELKKGMNGSEDEDEEEAVRPALRATAPAPAAPAAKPAETREGPATAPTPERPAQD